VAGNQVVRMGLKVAETVTKVFEMGAKVIAMGK
jgi:hypothetical protein